MALAEIDATPTGRVCRLGASDLDGEALRLFIGWSEAAERPVKGARVGIVGITFNEDVPDLRNSLVRDIVAELRELAFAAFEAAVTASTKARWSSSATLSRAT